MSASAKILILKLITTAGKLQGIAERLCLLVQRY